MNRKDLRNYLMQNAAGAVSDKIMDYVLDQPFYVTFMSLERLAYSTESTVDEVTDFFRGLGFETFLDFKNALRNSNYYEKKDNQYQRTDIRKIADQIMRLEMQNLTEFFSNFDYDLLDRFAQDVLSASEVVVVGMRVGAPYAYYLTSMLNHIGIKATRFDIRDCNYVDLIKTLDRSVLVISFGFRRYHKATVVSTGALKKRGHHVVAITDSLKSPVAAVADYSFVVPVHSYDYADSFTAGMRLIDLLTFRISLLDYDRAHKSLNDYIQLTNELELFN